MPTPARVARQFLLPIACLLALSACAHWSGNSPGTWAGQYELGTDRLHLLPSGEFTYDGGYCMPEDTDVGLGDAFAGRYRVHAGWITLEPLTGAPGCSSLGLKLHALRIDGHRYLFDEKYLRFIVNEIRSGKTRDNFPTWHPTGEPAAFTAPPTEWLPAPYAQWARQPAPSGHVIAIGPTSTRTRYGSAGLVLGEQLSARLTVDIGRRDGAFEGMHMCVPGGTWKLALDSVAEEQATLAWSWAKEGGNAPEVGMRLEGRCP
ncbi:hypothetical protein [Agrilutibacter solisilvae]|uniref:Lipoprotein n=1 Tax=Agrilutibacter solisilvae TaxID=2763317 RepID=A0A974Y020_9GAMM|nr:hypothetical protein [Lysobacter solisilvae]QSX78927.1 hypothetical protein I8J32_003095 [Lysobacter solisilvae]